MVVNLLFVFGAGCMHSSFHARLCTLGGTLLFPHDTDQKGQLLETIGLFLPHSRSNWKIM